MRNPILAAIFVSFTLSACSSLKQAMTSRNLSGRCDEAVSQGLAYGKGGAQAIAEAGIRHQIDDVRGYLLTQGFHKIRPAGGQTVCQPWSLGGGLTQCVVVKRFCGH